MMTKKKRLKDDYARIVGAVNDDAVQKESTDPVWMHAAAFAVVREAAAWLSGESCPGRAAQKQQQEQQAVVEWEEASCGEWPP